MAKQTTSAITFTSQAFELLRRHMDDEGRLTTPVRVSLECVRAMWVADARQRVAMDDITLPKGSDIGTITDMLAFAAEVRSEDSRISGWRMPPLSTAYLCDDGRVRTIGEMLEGISVDLMPHDDVDLDLLMACFGCNRMHPSMLEPFGERYWEVVQRCKDRRAPVCKLSAARQNKTWRAYFAEPPKEWHKRMGEERKVRGRLHGLPYLPLSRMRATHTTIVQEAGVLDSINQSMHRNTGAVQQRHYMRPDTTDAAIMVSRRIS